MEGVADVGEGDWRAAGWIWRIGGEDKRHAWRGISWQREVVMSLARTAR